MSLLHLPMWLFGPEAVPCQWHPPLRIKKKIHRNNRRNTHTQVSSTYNLGSSFHNIWRATGPCIQSGEGVHWRERQNQKAPAIVSKRGLLAILEFGRWHGIPRAKTWRKIWMTGLNPTNKVFSSVTGQFQLYISRLLHCHSNDNVVVLMPKINPKVYW